MGKNSTVSLIMLLMVSAQAQYQNTPNRGLIQPT